MKAKLALIRFINITIFLDEAICITIYESKFKLALIIVGMKI